MLFDSWEHDSHGVGAIFQKGNLHSIHVVGELLDVRLQLCERCGVRGDVRETLLKKEEACSNEVGGHRPTLLAL